MEIDREGLRALLSRLNELDDASKKEELERVRVSNPELFEQFTQLVTAARAAEDAAQMRADDPKLSRALSAASKTPRLQHIAQTLTQMGGPESKTILAGIGSLSPALAQAIQLAMFSFDDLQYGDPRGVQNLLGRVDRKTLRYALRIAPDEVVEHLMKQLSRRAAEQLQDDMEVMGKVRRRDALAAQQTLVSMARKLVKDGELIIIKPGQSDEWVD